MKPFQLVIAPLLITLLLSLTFDTFAQENTSKPRWEVYRIQIGVFASVSEDAAIRHDEVKVTPMDVGTRSLGEVSSRAIGDCNNVLCKFKDIVGPETYNQFHSLGLVQQTDYFIINPDQATNRGFVRVVMGSYVDIKSALYVWERLRAIGDKYPSLGFDKCFITSEPYWGVGGNGMEQEHRYTLQLETVTQLSPDPAKYKYFVEKYRDVYFQVANGKFKVFIGLFDEQHKATPVLMDAKERGYNNATVVMIE